MPTFSECFPSVNFEHTWNFPIMSWSFQFHSFLPIQEYRIKARRVLERNTVWKVCVDILTLISNWYINHVLFVCGNCQLNWVAKLIKSVCLVWSKNSQKMKCWRNFFDHYDSFSWVWLNFHVPQFLHTLFHLIKKVWLAYPFTHFVFMINQLFLVFEGNRIFLNPLNLIGVEIVKPYLRGPRASKRKGTKMQKLGFFWFLAFFSSPCNPLGFIQFELLCHFFFPDLGTILYAALVCVYTCQWNFEPFTILIQFENAQQEIFQ